MKRLARFPLLPLLGLAMVAARPVEAEQLAFELYALGFSVADSTMSFDLTPTTYRMELRYQTTGLARWVAGDSLDQTVSGTFQKDLPIPLQFSSAGRLKGHDRMVTLLYRDGDPTTTAISPPNETEREIVPRQQRDHTIDTLSATIDMLHLAQRTGHCDVSVNTYDGRRLEVFEAHTAGEEELPPTNRSTFSGRALRCDYSSRPVAGLKLGDGRDDDARTRAGTIWLAPVTPGGQRLPVRGLVDVRFLGSATMYLTGVTP